MHPQVLEALLKLKVVVVVPADPEDPCMVNEAEGECKIDRLKQQIDLPGPQVGKPSLEGAGGRKKRVSCCSEPNDGHDHSTADQIKRPKHHTLNPRYMLHLNPSDSR